MNAPSDVLLKEVKDTAEVIDHSKRTPFFETRLINFDLHYNSYPKPNALQFLVSNITDEVMAYEKECKSRKRSRNEKERKQLRRTVQALILNVIYTESLPTSNDAIYLSISLDKNCYNGKQVNEFQGATYAFFKAVYDALTDSELAYLEVMHEGYVDVELRKSYRTCIASTDKLKSAIETVLGENTITCILQKDVAARNAVFLKGTDKKPIAYKPTKSTKTMQTNLKRINSLLAENAIGLQFSGEIDRQAWIDTIDEWEEKDNKRKHYIDLLNVTLRRIFNNGRFDEGGRFYGGWWQGVPEDSRKDIRINGNQTVELDYSQMHPTMLYAEEGVAPPKNPYQPISGVEKDYGKIAFNGLLNTSDTPPKSPNNFNKKHQGLGIKWKGFLEAIEAHHSTIRHRLRTGYGLRLQYVDSQIAERVLMHFTDKGIPCLPIHDSFIVESKYEKELREVMHNAARDIAGVEIGIKAKGV